MPHMLFSAGDAAGREKVVSLAAIDTHETALRLLLSCLVVAGQFQALLNSGTTHTESNLKHSGRWFDSRSHPRATEQYNLIRTKGRWCAAAGKVTADLATSGRLSTGLWLRSSAGWLPRTWISSDQNPTLISSTELPAYWIS